MLKREKKLSATQSLEECIVIHIAGPKHMMMKHVLAVCKYIFILSAIKLHELVVKPYKK